MLYRNEGNTENILYLRSLLSAYCYISCKTFGWFFFLNREKFMFSLYTNVYIGIGWYKSVVCSFFLRENLLTKFSRSGFQWRIYTTKNCQLLCMLCQYLFIKYTTEKGDTQGRRKAWFKIYGLWANHNIGEKILVSFRICVSLRHIRKPSHIQRCLFLGLRIWTLKIRKPKALQLF